MWIDTEGERVRDATLLRGLRLPSDCVGVESGEAQGTIVHGQAHRVLAIRPDDTTRTVYTDSSALRCEGVVAYILLIGRMAIANNVNRAAEGSI